MALLTDKKVTEAFETFTFNVKKHPHHLKAASIQEIKSSLSELEPTSLREICLRLAKHKKENKELLSYLLFDASDINSYVQMVKDEIDEQFKGVNQSNLYFAKKTLRKILRITNKHIRFTASKVIEAELLLHYLIQLKKSGLRFRESRVLLNMYDQQLKKINAAVDSLHEDLRFDFQKSIDEL
jgi:hypothetical protein